MRNIDGTLNGDLNDNTSATTTGSIITIPVSNLDENLTSYDLLPVVINQPPIITKPLSEASRPQIRSSVSADATGKFLYQFPDGTIKVAKGTTFELRVEAQQPNTFNIENGIPVIKEANQDLYYQWKRDEAVIRTSTVPSLGQKTIVSGSVIRFERIQPGEAGTYTVEISNDIGAISSEPITIEVYNVDLDSYFYRNLVLNGSATDNVNNWEGDTTELVARSFSTKTTQELKTPNRVDLFGYNADMMHPRPYQIETGVVKGVDYEKLFLGKGKGNYFSRDVYKFESAGGKFYVKTYQDIDISEIRDFIRGSIYGIDGVRAIFGCYIGNAISAYTPTRETMFLESKTDPSKYFLGAPRISLENFLLAGPGFVTDRVYVTLEEFDNETRLVSKLLNSNGQAQSQPNTITLMDPWTKRLSKNYGKKYYPRDIYGLGTGTPITSLGNGYDATLFTADELYPDINSRPTHGQYLEFNRIVLERLNPKTTKIRISLNFYMDDLRLFDAQDYKATNSERIWETISWEKNYKKNTFGQQGSSGEVDFIRSAISLDPRYKDKPLIERVPLAPPPRVAVTGMSLCLLPIERQNAASTKYYTAATFNKNSRPEVRVPSALISDAVFDPKGILKRNLHVFFEHNSTVGVRVQQRDVLQTNRTTIRLKSEIAGLPPTQPTPSSTTVLASTASIFPFKIGSKAFAYNANLANYEEEALRVNRTLEKYSRLIYSLPSGSEITPQKQQLIETTQESISGQLVTQLTRYTPSTSTSRIREGIWKNKFSYTLHYLTRPSASVSIPVVAGDEQFKNYVNSFTLVVDYTLPKPVQIYADSLKGHDTVFEPTEYGIDAYGGFYFNIPTNMAITPVNKGGLGIPSVRYSGTHTGEEALTLISSSLSGSTLQEVENNTNLQQNLENLFNGYLVANNIQIPAPGEPAVEYTAALAKKPQFKSDITNYLYKASGSLSLSQLIVKWNVDAISAQIKTNKVISNPNWTTTLLAVSVAPQIGANFNGTPVVGRGVDGANYNLTYPQIVDTQTQI